MLVNNYQQINLYNKILSWTSSYHHINKAKWKKRSYTYIFIIILFDRSKHEDKQDFLIVLNAFYLHDTLENFLGIRVK